MSQASNDPDQSPDHSAAGMALLDAEKLALAEQEVASLKDKWLRAVADHENFKKRTRREIDDAVFRARQDLLSSFFPTADNLDRALELARGNEQLFKGIEMVAHEFRGALARHGIEPVPTVGHPFDPALHEALSQVDSADHAPGTVTFEFERGYRQGDRLLRPARVVIAGPGSTGSPGKAGPAA
ncbi:nucleotide exchange factor GrpE [Nannocystis sp.]|uniref:nucleotide exchange factor GrpE n=1 Tax=Nannocystis sp. TaxID=1962667 RepID=UPI00242258F7|nr:nucleotide exchange factor GrpE [Nannocystis sp.]MBK7827766.1 nucleotide exchange factor GrpE [Nannocystis sp.]MBK9753806.1 nucleotide exchange factor GrpE [Nannocystis sp.]